MLTCKPFLNPTNFFILSAGTHFSKMSTSAVLGVHMNITMSSFNVKLWLFSTSLMEFCNNFSNFIENFAFKKYENFIFSKFYFFEILFFRNFIFFKSYDSHILNFNENHFWVSFIYFTFSQKPDDIILNQALMEHQNNLITDKLQKQLIETNEEYFLKQLDDQFRSKITPKLGYFSNNFNSFEFQNPISFSKNSKFESYFFDGFLKTASFIVIYELLSSFYFEPLFFFWEKIERTMTEFRLVCYFWERSVLFEEWVYQPKIIYNNPNHIFPPLSHLSHKSDFEFSYKLIADLFDYKNTSTFSYYLEFQDLQTYAFDKNFVYLWNYNIGASNPLNFFGPKGWTGYINFLREQLANPKIQFPSIYHRNDQSYDSFATWTLNFAFFPDQVLLWGIFNPNFDWLTAGYNWFFHFGDNYMDYCIGLDFMWHQITDNYWGDFEYIVEDFTVYQTTYFPDSLATLWLPVILLATKNYSKQSDMTLHINDFNGVFQFKKIKTFEEFNSEKFFSLDPLLRLQLLRDFQQIDERPFHLEKILNIYYAYNFSCFTANFPSWLLNLVAPDNFYTTLIYDYEEDWKMEEWEWIIIKWLAKQNYDYSTNLSIYFKAKKFDNFFFNLPKFLNEKIFDDIGFFYGSLNWTEWPESLTTLTWLNTWSILTVEYIPIGHFSWKFTFFDSTPFWFNIILQLPTDFLMWFSEFLSKTFTIKITNHIYPLFIETWNTMFSYNVNLPSLYFEINFLPTFEFILSNINSKFYDKNSGAFIFYKFYEGNLLIFLNFLTIYNFLNFNTFINNIITFMNTIYNLQFTIYFNQNMKLESDFFTLKSLFLYIYKFSYFFEIFYFFEIQIESWIKFVQKFYISEFLENLEIFFFFPTSNQCTNYLNLNSILIGNKLKILYSNFQPKLVTFLYLVWYFFSSPENFMQIWNLIISENLFKLYNLNKFLTNIHTYKNNFSKFTLIEFEINSKLKLLISTDFFPNNFFISKILDFFKLNLSLLLKLWISFFTFDYHYTSTQHFLLPGTKQPILIINHFKSIAWFLPIEFFLPIFNYTSDNYLVEWCLIFDFLNNTSLPDGTELKLNNLWQVERFICYCIVLDIQLKNYNEKELIEIISAINTIDFNSFKNNRLEYDRYLNYVLRKKLYKKKG